MIIRSVAAVAVLVSGYVHLALWLDGVRDQDVIGPAFLVNAVAAVVIAALLILWRHRVPLLLCVGFALATLGAFVVSSTVGLFGVHATWSGGWVWAATVSEVVAAAAALVAARQEGYLASGGQLQHRPTLGRPHLH